MKSLKNIRISSVHFIPLSFLIMIIIGTALLMLPFSVSAGGENGIVTALFTSTTSVCVTGLVVTDTYLNWSLFGQMIILILVQIGGLGVVAVGSFIMLVGRKKFSLSERKLIGDSLDDDVAPYHLLAKHVYPDSTDNKVISYDHKDASKESSLLTFTINFRYRNSEDYPAELKVVARNLIPE